MQTTSKTDNGLGNVALLRCCLDDAEEWMRRSLAIQEAFGDRHGIAMTHGAFGAIAEQRGEIGMALRHMVRAVSFFPSFPDPASGFLPDGLLRYALDAGERELEEGWREVTGIDLPAEV